MSDQPSEPSSPTEPNESSPGPPGSQRSPTRKTLREKTRRILGYLGISVVLGIAVGAVKTYFDVSRHEETITKLGDNLDAEIKKLNTAQETLRADIRSAQDTAETAVCVITRQALELFLRRCDFDKGRIEAGARVVCRRGTGTEYFEPPFPTIPSNCSK